MSSQNAEGNTSPEERLASQMRKLGTRTVLYQQHVASSLGLSNTDLKSVDILWETGPITAGELSKITGLSTGTVTALIDRLEKAGYVRREQDPSDRRRVMIVPDYFARDEVRETFKPLHDSVVRLGSSYTAEQIELLIDFAAKISGIMEEQIRTLGGGRSKSAAE
ncbi:MarR family transcriptional regulator [Paenibacillus favisporus]|nr:MarR family transcriptional regulator [Paenibacillus favisporus]MEC0173533.1 MarR family transcriptional regulator [Paenibacillus favisporus]